MAIEVVYQPMSDLKEVFKNGNFVVQVDPQGNIVISPKDHDDLTIYVEKNGDDDFGVGVSGRWELVPNRGISQAHTADLQYSSIKKVDF